MIKLYKCSQEHRGITRLQSQLYVGGDTADFILDKGVLKHYNKGSKGFGYYEYKEPYQIVEDKKEMLTQML